MSPHFERQKYCLCDNIHQPASLHALVPHPLSPGSTCLPTQDANLPACTKRGTEKSARLQYYCLKVRHLNIIVSKHLPVLCQEKDHPGLVLAQNLCTCPMTRLKRIYCQRRSSHTPAQASRASCRDQRLLIGERTPISI